MSFFKAGRHSSTETRDPCPRCGAMAISGRRCPNPQCGYKQAPNVAQVFLDPFLDVGRAAEKSVSGGASRSSGSSGCATVIVVILLLAVGYALLKTILPYLIGGVVLLVGGGIFYALGKKVGFGKALLICAVPAIGAFFWLRHRAAQHAEQAARQEKQEQDEWAAAKAAKDAAKAKVVADKLAAFQTGYPKLAAAGDGSLATPLVGVWKLREKDSSSTTNATMSAIMLSGIDPNLSEVRYRLTSERLIIAGKGKHYGDDVSCGGAIEPVGLGDRYLFALGCQEQDGDLRWSTYTTLNAKLSKEMKTAGTAAEEGLIASDLRGVWLAADGACPPKDWKRRTVITASMILGNGGNEDDGIFQIRATPAAGGTTFEGMSGSSYDSKRCKGRLESSGAGAVTLSVHCDGQYSDKPTQLCNKAPSWVDL